MKLHLVIVMSLVAILPGRIEAWSNNGGTGTLGFGTVEICTVGEYQFTYSIDRKRPGASMRRGVQLMLLKWDDIFAESSYFKLRSEFFVASTVEEERDEASLTVSLQPGKYIMIYGQWYGISHDNPNDPYFSIGVRDLKGMSIISSVWAGDVSMLNPSGRVYMAGQWGAIGKISAYWDNAAEEIFEISRAFPGAKKVTHFGAKEYQGLLKSVDELCCP